MGSNKHSYYIVFCEFILLKSFLPSALILLLILRLQLLCTPTIVSREPSDVWKEVTEAAEKIPEPLPYHLREFFSLLIFFEFEDGHNRDVIEVEGPIYLDPLQANKMIVTGLSRDELEPYVLCDEVVLVFG